MSTETVEAPAGTTAVHEEKQIPAFEKLSPLSQALITSAKVKADEIKAVAEKQAKVGNVGELLSEAIANSTDAEIVEMRKKRERAAKAVLDFDKAMEEKVKPTLSIPSDSELAEMDTTYKTLASELNTFNGVFTTEVAKDYPQITLFDYVGELPKGRKGAKAGQGTGTSRPRVKEVALTQDQKGEEGYSRVGTAEKSTFSHLALKIKELTGETVSASDFHEEWTKQNNVKDWTEINEVSKFAFSVTDKEGKTHQFWVRVTR